MTTTLGMALGLTLATGASAFTSPEEQMIAFADSPVLMQVAAFPARAEAIVAEAILEQPEGMDALLAGGLEANPELSLAGVVGKVTSMDTALAADVVAAAIALNPAEAQSYIDIAVDNGADSQDVLEAAILAGADPTLVVDPTASGSFGAATSPAPQLSDIGGAGSGHGGGSASPN